MLEMLLAQASVKEHLNGGWGCFNGGEMFRFGS